MDPWSSNEVNIVKMEETSDNQMNYGLLFYLKLARVDVGNVSEKGENMEDIIT